MNTEQEHADVLIVGSGIMGAGVAQTIRCARPNARIVMVEAGPVIGERPGGHLHDTPDAELWARHNQRVSSGIQSLYLGADLTKDVVTDITTATPGMLNLSALGDDANAMPASAVAWNVGGMGIHWTAATPTPWGDEVFDFGDVEGWDADLAAARGLLHVHASPLGPTSAGEKVLDVLDAVFGDASARGRAPQPMPMAANPTADGWLHRTGPADIFPPLENRQDPFFALLAGTLALAVENDGHHASGVRVREIASGVERTITAAEVVIAGDTLRTPQLLFASGIRPWALGRYLNEHAFLTGRVLVDLDRLGVRLDELPRRSPGEWSTDSLWLPHSGAAQPFHGQIMNTTYTDDDDAALAYSIGLSWYVPTELRAENRLAFSATEVDAAGMPKITVDFSYSDADLQAIDEARASQRTAAEAFGRFDPDAESALLAAGSSLHYTGTVRTGRVDDGTTVCGPDGRVWGFDNLAVAGNGAVPTAVVCNVTLTGMVTAVRAARGISARLAA